MKLFISWSGLKSLAVAEVLREELPCLINELEIFLSSEDIEKGSAWFQSVASELDKTNFGIICLTAENLHKPWILFEAGALAGKFSQKKVAPLLIDLEPTQVAPPLSHLQLTKFVDSDFFRLLSSINKNASKPLPETILERSFKRSWNEIATKVKAKLAALPKLASGPVVDRSPEEKLDELLSIVRSIASSTSKTNGLSGLEPFTIDYLKGVLLEHEIEKSMELGAPLPPGVRPIIGEISGTGVSYLSGAAPGTPTK